MENSFPITQSPSNANRNFKTFGILAALLASIFLLWFFWKAILLGTVFFGSWIVVARKARKDGKSRKFAIGSGLLLGFVFAFTVSLIFKGEGKSEEEEIIPASASASQKLIGDAWGELDKETRKNLVESKYKEAKQLSDELDQFLKYLNRGEDVSFDMIGRIRIWKGNVPSLINEIESYGWEPGVSSNYNAMAEIHSALTCMESAWQTYETALGAATPEDMRTYAVMHTTSLKYVKENLSECLEYSSEGEY